MTPLRTPSEVNAFLAEHVMGWPIGLKPQADKGPGIYWTVAGRIVQGRDGGEWDPWHNVAHAIEALEAWAHSDSRRCGRYYKIEGWGNDLPDTRLYESGRGQLMKEEGRTVASSACRALCSLRGAEVQIEEALGLYVVWSGWL